MIQPRDIEQTAQDIASAGISRRHFFKIGVAGLAATVALPSLLRAQVASYRVGAAVGSDGYVATQRAIGFSGEWPSVAGRVVVIKPNIVSPTTAETGTVTDPEVVRAVVDRALQDGAAFVLIVEASGGSTNFVAAGYGFFDGYDPLNRVHLLDLEALSVELQPNPSGWIYKNIYMAKLLALEGVVFINVAKLKTHIEGAVTLAAKNLFGLPDVNSYISPRLPSGRFAMHDRGVSQTIWDLNVKRPSHFTVIDGIWGMEGDGPLRGDPVQMNTVLAGRNVVAVDRIGMHLMEVPQGAARHIQYLSLIGFGPSSINEIEVVGDPLTTRPFVLPDLPPDFSPAKLFPKTINPGIGESVSISIAFYEQCFRRLEIVEVFDDNPDVTLIRTVIPLSLRGQGVEAATWDGRADDGTLVSPGRYAVRVTAFNLEFSAPLGATTSFVTVV